MSRSELSTVVIGPDDAIVINGRLKELVEETAARCAVLLDRSGQIVARVGLRPSAQVDTLAALIAANFAAAREIARILGEDGFHVQVQQGTQANVLTHYVSDNWLLGVLFGEASTLGLVRLTARKVATQLSPLYLSIRSRELRPAIGSADFGLAVATLIDTVLVDNGKSPRTDSWH